MTHILGGWEGHAICVIMTHCVQKSTCDSTSKSVILQKLDVS